MNDNNDILRSILLGKPLSSPTPPPSSFSDLLTSMQKSQGLSSPTRVGLPPITATPPKRTGIKILPLIAHPKNEDELIAKVRKDTNNLLLRQIKKSDAFIVPKIESVAFDEGKNLETSILHIDMRNSTEIIETFGQEDAMKIYKIFHASMVETLRLKNARIRTFAGDRIGALFDLEGDYKRSNAVKTALLMDKVMLNVVNPIFEERLGYTLEYGIGIDFGSMLVGRIGKYGDTNNDLVWVGESMNRASKLADKGSGIFVSQNVHDKMDEELREAVGMLWQENFDGEVGTYFKFVGIQ